MKYIERTIGRRVLGHKVDGFERRDGIQRSETIKCPHTEEVYGSIFTNRHTPWVTVVTQDKDGNEVRDQKMALQYCQTKDQIFADFRRRIVVENFSM